MSKKYLYLILLVAVLYLPFIDKAYHIDDFEYINMSGMIGWNPLRAAPTDYLYNGILHRSSLVPYEMTHPLLVPYLIKIFSALFGQSEVNLHLSFLIFVIMALISLSLIYRAFFPEGRDSGMISALFLLAAPAFLVNSQNLMTDVPMLALLLCSVACYSFFAKTGRPFLAIAGGSLLVLAAFTSYQALFFCVVLFLYLLTERRINILSIMSLALPGILLLIWFLLVYQAHGIFPFFKKVGEESANVNFVAVGLSLKKLFLKFISLLAFAGSSVLFLIPAYCVLCKSITRFAFITVSSFVILFFTVPVVADYALPSRSFLALVASLGFFALVETIFKCIKESRNAGFRGWPALFAIWVAGTVAYAMAIYPWMAARYVIPLLPPVIVVLARGMTRRSDGRARIIIATAVSLSVFFGMASAYSDYKYAGSYREFARSLRQSASKGKVWFIGKWGMQYYMQKEGARYLLSDDNSPASGDLVVVPEMPRFWLPAPSLQRRLVLVGERKPASPFPLRLFNGRSHAGFYSTNWGLLPFAISREPDEVFQLFEVI